MMNCVSRGLLASSGAFFLEVGSLHRYDPERGLDRRAPKIRSVV
jgi:hypothetical protein